MPRRLRDRPRKVPGGLGAEKSKSDAKMMPPPASSQASSSRPKPATWRSQADASDISQSSGAEEQSPRRRAPSTSGQREQAGPSGVGRKPPASRPSNSTSSESDGTSPEKQSAGRFVRRSRSESRASPQSDNNRGQRRVRSEARAASGVRALQEIRKLQETTNLLIPKLAFARVFREVLMEYSHRDLRVTADALIALQESAETYAVQLFEDSYRCTLHRERVTLTPKDMHLTLYMRHGR
ncbi:uncharacterized protein LOC128737986 [Sabethes cyaneus]|uniref:uncharacterized protein LOC128737986 n=1 Tax=Sabethes cyaneus TaxID=53552 RepID=UPI00237E0565|nr:uncharacterized protein LOC128737986 [Sabethes cyaneus]